MCCFSGNVSRVANTRIFGRVTPNATQILVYQMEYAAESDLAMILPLPTPPHAADDAVRFIDLSAYPEFFTDMEKGFPYTRQPVTGHGRKPQLQVQTVGSFDASFVPSQKDFERLDARFRLPADAWKELPEYDDFGFAVFKLRADAHTVHPLAFEFPTRNPQLLYFPTVHIHDGHVAEEANFDHDLYCQARAGWLRSYNGAGSFMDMERAQGVVDPNERISRMTVQGMHPNSDILVGLRA